MNDSHRYRAVVLGVVALVYQSITHTTREKVHLRKPFDEQVLLDAIRQVVGVDPIGLKSNSQAG